MPAESRGSATLDSLERLPLPIADYVLEALSVLICAGIPPLPHARIPPGFPVSPNTNRFPGVPNEAPGPVVC